MKSKLTFALCLLGFASTAFSAVEVRFTPGADAGPYRKVLIAPTEVRFHRDFLYQSNTLQGAHRRLSREETGDLARQIGESFRNALGAAFRARGFEIATAPAAGVLQLSPSLRDLYVNNPPASSRNPIQWYVRDAGHARIVVEGRDAAGSRVMVASEDATAGSTADFRRESEFSNRLWFETLFRTWAEDLAEVVARGK